MRLTLWTCGRCKKPRGMHHFCAGGRKARDRIGPRVSFTCRSCRKEVPNLLTHRCATRTDFRQRKAAQARSVRSDARKRRRKATAARKRARLKERKRAAAEKRKRLRAEAAASRARSARSQSHDRNRHEYAGCRDDGCARSPCRIYREGEQAGRAEGQAEGYAEGYAEGMTDAYKAAG